MIVSVYGREAFLSFVSSMYKFGLESGNAVYSMSEMPSCVECWDKPCNHDNPKTHELRLAGYDQTTI